MTNDKKSSKDSSNELKKRRPVIVKKNPLLSETANLTDSFIQKRKISPINVTKQLNPKQINAYKSSLGNLFTENDPTLDNDITILTEKGYWGNVIKALRIYDADELVAGLIDRTRCTANQNYNFNISNEHATEDTFWKEWTLSVNETAKNIPMGISNIFREMFQSMLVTGMAIPDVEWGKKRIDGKLYEVPVKISLLPVLGVQLHPGKFFGEEEIYLGINEEAEKTIRGDTSTDNKYQIRYFGTENANTVKERKPAILKPNAEAVKFNWSANNTTLYPTPLLQRAFHSVALRHKYLEADMSLLDGIIERIIHVKVGDKDTELYVDDESGEGDLTMAAAMFQDEHVTQMVVTPWYYEIEIIQPNVEALLAQDKYIQTTLNILNAFGIILDPDSSSNTTQDEQVNVLMFKEYIRELQQYVASWMTKICREVQKRNKSLKGQPKFSFDIPDLDNATIKANLLNLYNMGLLDAASVLEKFGFTPENIVERLKKQKVTEAKEGVFALRPTFKQIAQDGANQTAAPTTVQPEPAKKEKVSEKFDTGGRPKGK